jgi:hypothetical protein
MLTFILLSQVENDGGFFLMPPTHHHYSRRFKNCDTITARLNFKPMDTQDFTHVTIPNALMTTWERVQLGRDIMVRNRYCRLKK